MGNRRQFWRNVAASALRRSTRTRRKLRSIPPCCKRATATRAPASCVNGRRGTWGHALKLRRLLLGKGQVNDPLGTACRNPQLSDTRGRIRQATRARNQQLVEAVTEATRGGKGRVKHVT